MVPFFLPHGVHTFKYIFTRWTMDFLIWSQILPSWPNTSAWRTHQVCVTFISISAGYQLSSFYFTCCIKVAHTRTRLPSVGFRSWSRFLAVSSQVTWVINPETRWVWTVCPRLLPDSVAAANLKPGPSAPVSSTLTTLTCCTILYIISDTKCAAYISTPKCRSHIRCVAGCCAALVKTQATGLPARLSNVQRNVFVNATIEIHWNTSLGASYVCMAHETDG